MEFTTQNWLIKVANVAVRRPQNRATLGGASWMAIRRGARAKKTNHQVGSGGETKEKIPTDKSAKRVLVLFFTAIR